VLLSAGGKVEAKKRRVSRRRRTKDASSKQEAEEAAKVPGTSHNTWRPNWKRKGRSKVRNSMKIIQEKEDFIEGPNSINPELRGRIALNLSLGQTRELGKRPPKVVPKSERTFHDKATYLGWERTISSLKGGRERRGAAGGGSRSPSEGTEKETKERWRGATAQKTRGGTKGK